MRTYLTYRDNGANATEAAGELLPFAPQADEQAAEAIRELLQASAPARQAARCDAGAAQRG